MTNRRPRSYVLLEIMLSLLIFALAAWVCLTLFSRGGDAAREADELRDASRLCSAALERMRAGELADGGEILYNSDWVEIDSSDAGSSDRHYRLTVEASEGAAIATVTRFEGQSGEPVFRLTGGWLEPGLLGEATP